MCELLCALGYADVVEEWRSAITDAANEADPEALGENYAPYEFYKRRVSDAHKSPAERQASAGRRGRSGQGPGRL